MSDEPAYFAGVRAAAAHYAGGAIPAGKGPLSGIGLAAPGASYPGSSDAAPTTERGNVVPQALLPWTAFIDDRETVPDLIWPNSIYVYERMAQDAQVAGLVAGCVLPITRYRWSIDPNGASDKIVQQLAQDLNLPIRGQKDDVPQGRSKDRFSFRKHLGVVLDEMLTYGHLFCEQVGTIDDGLWRLRKLAPRPARTINQIDVARDGGLVGIKQQGVGMQSAVIPVQNLVAYVWRQEPGRWVGRSMLRPMYKHWLIKDRLMRVDAVKHERTGMGVPVGTQPPNGNGEAQLALARALAQLRVGDNAEITVPYGAKVELLGTQGSIPDTVASIRYHDELMARSTLMMFMQLGSTASGSRALGDSQTDYFSMAQESIAWNVCDTFNEHVIEDWVDWNYGPDEGAPLLTFERVDDDSLPTADLAELVRYGALTMDDETEGWIRERHKMPELTDPRPKAESTPKPLDPSAETDTPTTTAPTPDPKLAAADARGRREQSTWASTANPQGRQRYADDQGEHAAILPDRKLKRGPNTMELAAKTDFRKLDTMWDTATAALVGEWKAKVLPAQIQKIKAQQASAKTLQQLAQVSVEPAGEDVLYTHLATIAGEGIDLAHEEAVAQGETFTKPLVGLIESTLKARAEGTAILMANALVEVAGRTAVTQSDPANLDPASTADAVAAHIDGLGDRFLTDQLGGAVTAAQNDGRMVVGAQGGDGARYFASELLDVDTCDACAEVDGTEYDTLEEADGDYPAGGYIDCFGGPRCRGTVVILYEAEAGTQ